MVVQVTRLQDGTRKIVSIAEVLGVKEDRVDLQDIFIFDRTGVTDAGKVQGRFRSTGVTPRILEKLRIAGIQLSPAVFDEVLEVNM
jgi:pilus assembly protein CpaF